MNALEFTDLPSSARIWIYGAEQTLTLEQVRALEDHMDRFLTEWQSHGRPVTPSWQLVESRFIVIGADEAAFSLSGCSIDSMFHAVEDFNRASGLNFTRSGGVVFYRDGAGSIQCVERLDFRDLVKNGSVNADTPVFDNTVSSIVDFRDGHWEVPMRESWHMEVFGKLRPVR